MPAMTRSCAADGPARCPRGPTEAGGQRRAIFGTAAPVGNGTATAPAPDTASTPAQTGSTTGVRGTSPGGGISRSPPPGTQNRAGFPNRTKSDPRDTAATPSVGRAGGRHLGPATRGGGQATTIMVGPAHRRRATVDGSGRMGPGRTGMGARTRSHDGIRVAPATRMPLVPRLAPVRRSNTAPSTRTATGHPDQYSAPTGTQPSNRTPTVGPVPDAPGPRPSRTRTRSTPGAAGHTCRHPTDRRRAVPRPARRRPRTAGPSPAPPADRCLAAPARPRHHIRTRNAR